ncbi:MAG: HlyD family efflux transporter periplasmic adaptor subunit [Anaerolineae bacterium]|nr:HlyD family efflux transporter periplasmic adaptor subunit [Anaerolineae bacterium]
MYRRLRNWFVIGMLAILAAAFARYRMDRGLSLLPFAQANQDATAAVETTVVERGDIIVTVSAVGTLAPIKQLYLFFPVPGKVSAIAVAEGDSVEAGQELARLDTEQLELALQDASLALELQQIAFDALTAEPREVELEAARAAVSAASAQLAAASVPPDPNMVEIARLQLELAKNQLWQNQLQRDSARQQEEQLQELLGRIPVALPSPGDLPLSLSALPSASQYEAAVTRSEYDVAIATQQLLEAQNASTNAANIAAAQAALINAQGQLARLEEGPGEIELALADAQLQAAYLAVDLARYQLEQAILRAPFSGVVAQMNLAPGEPPPSREPAIELIDPSAFTVSLAVDEMDVALLEDGQYAEITVDALPDTILTGRVTGIDRVATSAAGLVTYGVEITLDQTTAPIRAGMSATVAVVVDEARDVLRLRNRFIRLDRRTGQATVTIRRSDGTLEDVPVTLGRRNETFSEVLSGLQAGDQIVLLPRNSLSNFGF